MRVGGFMKPAEQVVTCHPTDSVRKVVELMTENKIGAVVVVANGNGAVPDLIKAYSAGLTLDDHVVKEIMSTGLATCNEHVSRDAAAAILERNQNHHAIVVDPATNHFLGLVSSWDITVECAKDNRAWPWNRSEDGKFHKPNTEEKVMGTSPQSALFHPTSDGNPKLGDSFRDMVDNLVYFD